MGKVISLTEFNQDMVCMRHNLVKVQKKIGNYIVLICEECNCSNKDQRVDSFDEQAAKFREIRLSKLKLTDDLKSKGLGNYQTYEIGQDIIVETLRAYVGDVITGKPKCNLLLIGPTGSGKSHLATGVLKLSNELWMTSKSMSYISSYKLAQQEMNSWINKDQQSNVCEEYSNLDFLVIDDFGFNDEGPKMKIIQKILFLRHEKRKPTLITSNLVQDECCELMGDRVRSRFLGNLYKCLEVNFADYRLKE